MFKNKQKITVTNYFYLNPKRCGPFFLVQAGESFCSKDTIIPTHNQPCFEITFAISGSATCYANNVPTKIDEGDCFFSFANETHTIESDANNPLHFIFLAFFAKENTRENRYIEFLRENCVSYKQRKIKLKELSPLLISIISELKNLDEYSPRMIRAFLEQVLIKCCRKIHNKPIQPYPVRYSDNEMLVKDVIVYINEHVEQITRVSQLCDIFYYTEQSLSKIFRSQTGIPIGKYLNGKRMELANHLLSTGLSVTNVSERLQYSSIHTFSRAYKTYFHDLPSNKRLS